MLEDWSNADHEDMSRYVLIYMLSGNATPFSRRAKPVTTAW